MWVNCSVLRLYNKHFDQAGGLSLGENSGGENRHEWRWPFLPFQGRTFNLRTDLCNAANIKSEKSQQQQRQRRFPDTHWIPPRGRSCSITATFILCSHFCTTLEPFISFTYFSQNHPHEYAKGKLCGMPFPLEKSGCSFIKNNPFDLHLVLNNMKSF